MYPGCVYDLAEGDDDILDLADGTILQLSANLHSGGYILPNSQNLLKGEKFKEEKRKKFSLLETVKRGGKKGKKVKKGGKEGKEG